MREISSTFFFTLIRCPEDHILDILGEMFHNILLKLISPISLDFLCNVADRKFQGTSVARSPGQRPPIRDPHPDLCGPFYSPSLRQDPCTPADRLSWFLLIVWVLN